MHDRTDVPAQQHRTSTTRFPVAVDAALRDAGWQPGRWDIRQAEEWADALRSHASPAGHQHAVFPAAVEAWAEFGGLRITATAPGRQIATHHRAHRPAQRTPPRPHPRRPRPRPGNRGRPLGEEGDGQAVLAIDAEGRVYSIDHTGDWYLGSDIDHALETLMTGAQPARLTSG